MTVTAELKIQLWAGSVLVAESKDQELWSRNFAAMRDTPGGSAVTALTAAPQVTIPAIVPLGGSVDKLAAELGVAIEIVQSACDPLMEPPYLRLDVHRWAALKRNTPARGPNSVGPISLAATLLGLWFRHSRPDRPPTIREAQVVLSTLLTRDQNPARAIRSCPWLRYAGSVVTIKPDEIGVAVALARAYCLKQAPEDGLVGMRRGASRSQSASLPEVADQEAPVEEAASGGAVHHNTRNGRIGALGATAALRRMLDLRFFDVPKTGAEAQQFARDKLRVQITTNNVHGKLGDLMQAGLLERHKGSDNVYRYVVVGRSDGAVTQPAAATTAPSQFAITGAQPSEGAGRIPPVSRPASRRRAGAHSILCQLNDEGYFTESRTAAQVRKHVKHATGHTLTSKETPKALLRMLHERRLVRQQNAEGEYEYRAAGAPEPALAEKSPLTPTK